MASKESDYRLAREMQGLFGDSIKACMDGDLTALENVIKSFLRKNPTSTALDMIQGFQSEGKTLIHIASNSGKVEVLEYLFRRCVGDAQYNSFVTMEQQTSASSTLAKLANLSDQRGFSPLMNATISESLEMMKLLIKFGADVNSRNQDGASSLHFAAGDGSVPRLALLKQSGSLIDVQSKSGTPLHWAAGKGHTLAIQYLIRQGANVLAVNAEGLSAVLMAAVSGSDGGVKALVEAGADVGTIVSGNLTTLHICAENGLRNAVEAIINTETGKKSCTIQTSDGNLPIHLAAIAKHNEIVKLLIPLSGHCIESDTLDEDATVNKLLEDGVRRLALWEDAHGAKKSTDSSESASELTDSDRYFESIVCGSAITSEIETAAEKSKDVGNEHFKHRRFEEAIAAYSDAIEKNKHNASYWSNRSACYMSMNLYDKALIDAEICRKLNPTWVKGCFRLATARLALNQFEDAALAAFEGCKLEPNNQDLKTLMQTAVKRGQEEHRRKNNLPNPPSK